MQAQGRADGGVLAGEHIGGCVLHEKRDQVEAILKAQKH